MKKTSELRIKRFIDWLIRNESACPRFGNSSDDWLQNSERMDRIQDAAEYGCDGSTHREIIQDWRDNFYNWVRYDRSHRHEYPLFEAAVEAHFNEVEAWHHANGTLDEQIG